MKRDYNLLTHNFICERCFEPHEALMGMTPFEYYYKSANLGKYEEEFTYSCECEWLDEQID